MQNLFKWVGETWSSFARELNFFRIHVIFFTVTPLILGAILFAANGRYHISYIDALFNSISSITCCGLSTVNLSSMTGFQQFLLFLQLNIGNSIFVSWFVIFFRRQYFKKKLRHVLMAEAARKAGLRSPIPADTQRHSWSRRMLSIFRPNLSVVEEENFERKTDRDVEGKLRTDMIRRVNDAPKPINPSGRVVEKMQPKKTLANDMSGVCDENSDAVNSNGPSRSLSLVESLTSAAANIGSTDTMSNIPSETPTGGANRVSHTFPRHQTIEFAPSPQRPKESESQSATADPSSSNLRSIHRLSMGRYNTQNSTQTTPSRMIEDVDSSRDRGFGGFPMPTSLLNSAISKIFPKLKRHLSRTVTMPATTSFVSTHTAQRTPPNSKAVPYISFNATVGHNSEFKNLTNHQLEELGGLEYRALNILLWLVGAYFIGFQILGAIITMPCMYRQRWRSTFEPPALVRRITPGWFTVYQMSSSFTNTGNSLVDQSVIPYQEAYPLIIVQWILILVGNTIFPCVLRFIIWIMAKSVTRGSQLSETLHFLLDHPRRCYIYLFQSHQTWFLVAVTIFFTSLEWFFFMLLDIGNAAIEAIPLSVRFSSGLFQAVAVRAAGFSIFSLADVAPAVQVLYLVMMYITIFPIAMSVRATNVYEERALGIYREDSEDEEPEYSFDATGPNRVNIWGRYFAYHIRRQLAFDMWWLAIAVFVICIIERHNITNPDRPWFNVFAIIFETVSAYGPVGLSLGVAGENYSFSGSFSTLSKLVICATMLRGRHRNLPFALDRSIMLPTEFQKTDEGDTTGNNQAQRPYGTGTGSLYPIDDNEDNTDSLLHRRISRQESTISGSDSGSSRQNALNVIHVADD